MIDRCISQDESNLLSEVVVLVVFSYSVRNSTGLGLPIHNSESQFITQLAQLFVALNCYFRDYREGEKKQTMSHTSSASGSKCISARAESAQEFRERYRKKLSKRVTPLSVAGKLIYTASRNKIKLMGMSVALIYAE